jgi:hypothetical protein
MENTDKSQNPKPVRYTWGEKGLIALVWAIACAIVFLLLRH